VQSRSGSVLTGNNSILSHAQCSCCQSNYPAMRQGRQVAKFGDLPQEFGDLPFGSPKGFTKQCMGRDRHLATSSQRVLSGRTSSSLERCFLALNTLRAIPLWEAKWRPPLNAW
jgi:hypothetical protein